MALRSHLFVEVIIEQHDFALDPFPIQRLQFVKIPDHLQFRRESGLGRGDASAQRGENNFLRRLLGHSRVFDQSRRLFAAHPMRHGHLLEFNFEAERFQFSGHIFDRFLRLRRAAQARTDVVRKMRNLPVSVVARERSLLQFLEFPESLRGIGRGRRRCGWTLSRFECGALQRAGKSEGDNADGARNNLNAHIRLVVFFPVPY